MAMNFGNSSLITALPDGRMISWNMEDSHQPLPSLEIQKRRVKEIQKRRVEGTAIKTHTSRNLVAFAEKHGILAWASGSGGVAMWDFFTGLRCGKCNRVLPEHQTMNPPATCITFRPHPSELRIAVGYGDALIIFDAPRGQELVRTSRGCLALAASPNGEYIASYCPSKTIHIYEFNSLVLVHSIRTSLQRPVTMNFSSDCQRLLVLQNKELKIWTLSFLQDILVDPKRDRTDLSLSDGLGADELSLEEEMKFITCMAIDEEAGYLACGMRSGWVGSYDPQSGLFLRNLYRHESSVTTIVWWPGREVVLSADKKTNVMAWNQGQLPVAGLAPIEPAFPFYMLKAGKQVLQILPCRTMAKILISMDNEVALFNIESQEEQTRPYAEGRITRTWFQHPVSESHIISFDTNSVRIWTWKDISEVASYPWDHASLMFGLHKVFCLQSSWGHAYIMELKHKDLVSDGQALRSLRQWAIQCQGLPREAKDNEYLIPSAVSSLEIGGTERRRSITELDTSSGLSEEGILTLPTELVDQIKYPLGSNGSDRLVYLDRRFWVCSFTIESVYEEPLHYFRHFYVPEDWRSAFSNEQVIITKDFSFVIPREGGITILRGGLNFTDKILLKDQAQNSSSGTISLREDKKIRYRWR